jgi:transketolase
MPSRHVLANAIRALSMDAVQKANSGHPGMPMGMAEIAEVLWNDFLQHNPINPHWFNRDRFVLSNGHGAMLQYSLLHLTGYDLTMDDIKNFRQWHSKTPGHPEFGETPGVETTTGPLGQGLANGVGMALAEKTLAAQFNRPGHTIVDHHTYVFAGDGCLMEGVSHEACSLAGTLGLGKLIVFYDDNGISIDGKVGGWFTDNTPQRFAAYNWHVIAEVDGHDTEAVRAAIMHAQAVTDKPTLICCQTVIGHGAPNLAGSHKAHGSPLGEEEISAVRENIGWNYPPFVIPDEIYSAWDARKEGEQLEQSWQEKFNAYQKEFPELAAEFLRRMNKKLPKNWVEIATQYRDECQKSSGNIATRTASKNCLDAFAPHYPELLGGSADLTGSNLTWWSGSEDLRKTESGGNYLHYGVREFGMAAIMNGMAQHGGFIPYGGTFLVFIDYARNAARLSALMQSQVIYVLSHDSIGLGEDGPTHQPIEHASMLRMTPGMSVWRPCDAVETAVSWQVALEHQGPTSLLLSRQNLPKQTRDAATLENVRRGGYILHDSEGAPDAIIIATGSEVSIAMAAAEQLAGTCRVRVVSMPSTDVFLAQDPAYRQGVLPRKVTARVAIEAGSTAYWFQFVGTTGKVIGIDRFGASAPYQILYEKLGLTAAAVVGAVKECLEEAATPA